MSKSKSFFLEKKKNHVHLSGLEKKVVEFENSGKKLLHTHKMQELVFNSGLTTLYVCVCRSVGGFNFHIYEPILLKLGPHSLNKNLR